MHTSWCSHNIQNHDKKRINILVIISVFVVINHLSCMKKKDYSLITNKRIIDTKGTIFNIGPFLLHKCKEKSRSPVDIEWVLDLIFVIKDVCCFYSITVYFCVVLVLYLKWKIKGIFFFYILEIFSYTKEEDQRPTSDELNFSRGVVIDISSSHTPTSLNVQQYDSPVNKGNGIKTIKEFLFHFVKLFSQYQLKHG